MLVQFMIEEHVVSQRQACATLSMQIEFRDYLNANFERAKEYEKLKLQLALQFKNDRGAYVLGKTNFINETIDLIKKYKK
jgi:GrpB-like predicted nucleotidyltransferase (UPF0157 family)